MTLSRATVMMRKNFALGALFFALNFFAPLAHAGEKISIQGSDYPDAELTDVSREGIIFKTDDGSYVTLPWAETTAVQVSAVKAKLPDALSNALYDAHYVKGTVFQVTPDGVIIQIDLVEDYKGPEFKNGARVLTHGLVIVKDLPGNLPQGEGAAIEITAHKRQTYTYDLAIAAKEIPLLTFAKPLWGQEQEWKNTEGQAMIAKLVAVKDNKGMFEKGGKRFIYDLAHLDAEGRQRAAEIAEKLAGFPLF